MNNHQQRGFEEKGKEKAEKGHGEVEGKLTTARVSSSIIVCNAAALEGGV